MYPAGYIQQDADCGVVCLNGFQLNDGEIHNESDIPKNDHTLPLVITTKMRCLYFPNYCTVR